MICRTRIANLVKITVPGPVFTLEDFRTADLTLNFDLELSKLTIPHFRDAEWIYGLKCDWIFSITLLKLYC